MYVPRRGNPDWGRPLPLLPAHPTEFEITVARHTVHELNIWEDLSDRAHMLAQLQKGGPIRNIVNRLRTKSGEIKVTTYSADKIEFDGQACILAVSEDVFQYDPQQAN